MEQAIPCNDTMMDDKAVPIQMVRTAAKKLIYWGL